MNPNTVQAKRRRSLAQATEDDRARMQMRAIMHRDRLRRERIAAAGREHGPGPGLGAAVQAATADLRHIEKQEPMVRVREHGGRASGTVGWATGTATQLADMVAVSLTPRTGALSLCPPIHAWELDRFPGRQAMDPGPGRIESDQPRRTRQTGCP